VESRVDRLDKQSEAISEDQISKLPKELLEIEVGMHLVRNSNISPFISRISKRFHSFFPHEQKMALYLLRQLLGHGDCGELIAGENIWRGFPDLLTCRGTIYFPNRSYIDADGKELSEPIDIPLEQNPGRPGYDGLTYGQILLANEEFEEFDMLPISLEEKQKQFFEVFPDGKIVKHDWNLEKAKGLLQKVFEEIIKDEDISYSEDHNSNLKLEKMGKSTREALDALYDYAKPNPKHTIGLVCDANFYVEALNYYDDYITYKQFQNWQQRVFWCRQVEEWLAGGLGTVYLRPHSQGIGNQVTRVGCILADGSSYLAFRRPVNSVPGVDFFVGYCGLGPGRRHADRAGAARYFQHLCRASTRAGTDFTQRFAASPEASLYLSL